MKFNEVLMESGEFKKYLSSLSNTPVSVSGIADSALAHFIHSSGNGKRKLCVVYGENEAKALYKDLCFFEDNVIYYPMREFVYYNVDAFAHFDEHRRINALNALQSGEKGNVTVVASLSAILSPTISPEQLAKHSFCIKAGESYNIDKLSERLVAAGYTRNDITEGCGQFSLRGGILDVFSPGNDFPYRIEFFDDEADSVRVFDYVSQRTLEMTDCAVILPCREICPDEKKCREVTGKIEKLIESVKRKKGDYTELIENITAEKEKLETGRTLENADKYYSYFYDKIYTLTDYFDNDDMIFVSEPKRLAEKGKSTAWEEEELVKELCEKNLLSAKNIRFSLPFAEFCKKSSEMVHVSVNSLNHSSLSYTYNAIFSFESRATVSLHGKIDYLFSDLENWRNKNATVIILAQNRGRGENISGILNDKGIPAVFNNDKKEFEKGKLTVICGDLKKGFEYPALDFILISEHEIFDTEKKVKKRKLENTQRIKSYNDINVGDYVVHRAHGIGRYDGMKRMTVAGVSKDYLKVSYQGTDSLYVPVDQMDLLFKYIGNTDKEIKLNKLGTSEWQKTKAKVKKSTEDIAKQLIELYAKRAKSQGFAYPPDGPWQRDFEDTFGFEETEDQLRSIEEVKTDMESTRPMDRLLCGDVGYGKTEVAIRAAFKAAVNSKQVAYLCPTTVLAMQHYDTFRRRMEDFAVKVEMLSRFRTQTQQKKILKAIKNGEIDIVIGTHRILSRDVEFKDLGLLIIDEEQRFGVKAKEKLKELKQTIDVLSMTATPIPRTLHMSMVNIRDMSVLETPPENRYPVQTYVLEYNEQTLIEAMKKELSRGGQVFFLHNQIENIYAIASRISELIPDASVAVGHGRMNENQLEDIMYDMVNGNTDILVCTTIIETGLDIPNANTIIINNADRMGLAQLYQLRGRVGRSNRSAYAYLVYRPDKVLSEVAEKRLKAIKEFTEFGSGFKIAMRDLEIRGAGNILGAQQHGHMDAVGYDMYCKILKESVDELSGKETNEEITTSVDFALDAFIPETYIANNNMRIDVYKKIASITTEEDMTEIFDELCDRFGDVPKPVVNLINIAYLKALANSVGIVDINAKKTMTAFKFAKDRITPELCIKLISEFPGKITVSSSIEPTIIYKYSEPDQMITNIKFVLQAVIRLKSEEK